MRKEIKEIKEMKFEQGMCFSNLITCWEFTEAQILKIEDGYYLLKRKLSTLEVDAKKPIFAWHNDNNLRYIFSAFNFRFDGIEPFEIPKGVITLEEHIGYEF